MFKVFKALCSYIESDWTTHIHEQPSHTCLLCSAASAFACQGQLVSHLFWPAHKSRSHRLHHTFILSVKRKESLCLHTNADKAQKQSTTKAFEWAPPPPPTKTYQTVKVVQIIIINVLSVQTKNTGWFEVTEKYFHQKKLSWKCSTKLSHDRKKSKISTAQRHQASFWPHQKATRCHCDPTSAPVSWPTTATSVRE